MMDRELLVEIREIYGVKRIYPLNEVAKNFLSLVQAAYPQAKKCLTELECKRIKALGYSIKVQAQEL